MRINKSFIALTSSDATVAWGNITGTPTTLSGYGITDGVPTSRTLTINGTTFNLSANRTWTIPTDNIYNANGTLTANRTVTLGGYSLTFTGSATSTVVHSTGRLLLGGASDNAAYNLNLTGSANISNSLNVGVRIDATTVIIGANMWAATTRVTSYSEIGLISSISTPSVGFGFLYGKSDKKIYWKNSDGTDYDLTTGSGGTVTSVALATGTTGTDVNVSGSPITSSGTITINIPDASSSNARGLVTNSTQTFGGMKTFAGTSTVFNSFIDLGTYARFQKVTLSSGAPASGKSYLWYNSSTNTLYFRNDANVDYDLTSSSTSVPLTRTLTINDTAYDLSANRSWDIGDYGTW